MKNIILSLFILYSFVAISQEYNTTPNTKLLSKYTTEYLKNLSEKEPQSILYLNYCVDNSYVIISDFPSDKIEHLPILKKFDKDSKSIIEVEITKSDIDNFNLFEYFFERNNNSRKHYRIGNSNKVLQLFSEEEIIENYNKLYHSN